MRVDGDAVFRRGLDDLQVVLHLALAVVPFEHFRSAWLGDVGVAGDDPAGIGDVASLDHVDAERGVHLHRVFELRLVDLDIAAGLVMADEVDALAAGVVGDFL